MKLTIVTGNLEKINKRTMNSKEYRKLMEDIDTLISKSELHVCWNWNE